MNKKRRASIEAIINAIGELTDRINQLKDDEEESLNNLPDSFRVSERGERMEEIVDLLDSAGGDLDNAKENLNESIQ